jgi:hypothetical protein
MSRLSMKALSFRVDYVVHQPLVDAVGQAAGVEPVLEEAMAVVVGIRHKVSFPTRRCGSTLGVMMPRVRGLAHPPYCVVFGTFATEPENVVQTG